MSTQCVIKVTNLSFSYDGIDLALENINTHVHARDCMAIVGPNGGGKTTLLRLLCGRLNYHKGEIEILGQSPRKMHKVIGYVPQSAYYDASFPIRVLQVVLMGRLGSGGFPWYSKQDRKIAMHNLEKMDILQLSSYPFHSLSGGQKQRVLIARALSTNAEILFFDEPTANLDISTKKQFYELLQQLNNDYTILIVTHNIHTIPKFAKSVLFVNRHSETYRLENATEQEFLQWYQEKINV